MANENIVHEAKRHYVVRTDRAFIVYRNEITHAVKCATIGLSLGLERAISEVTRREALSAA